MREPPRAGEPSPPRGFHGSPSAGGAHGVRGVGAAAARSHRETAAVEFDPVDDPLRPHTNYAAAGNPDGHDAAGPAAGGVPFSSPGPGNPDRAVESHLAGTGADDDLVSHEPGS